MTKSLNEFRKTLKPEVQKAARAKAVDILVDMSLAELRKQRGYSQVELAQHLGIAQPNVSQIENRPDALISTLGQYIEALGGRLEIHARFPDATIEITQFKDSHPV